MARDSCYILNKCTGGRALSRPPGAHRGHRDPKHPIQQRTLEIRVKTPARRSTLFALPFAFLLPISLAAQTFDSLAFVGMRWRELGPYRGGRSVAVAGSDKRTNEYWMGTTGVLVATGPTARKV